MPQYKADNSGKLLRRAEQTQPSDFLPIRPRAAQSYQRTQRIRLSFVPSDRGRIAFLFQFRPTAIANEIVHHLIGDPVSGFLGQHEPVAGQPNLTQRKRYREP
jgi:hypothetical protein